MLATSLFLLALATIFAPSYSAVEHSPSMQVNNTVVATVQPLQPFNSTATKDQYNITYLLETLLQGYDKRLRPNFGGRPVNVTVTTFIEFIGDINEINMEFTTIMYFRQYWEDSRLAYANTGYTKRLAFNPEMMKFIWVPDTHFPGLKEGYRHDITASNEVVRIFPNGTVLYSMRLKVTSQCPMDLRNFPMDRQKCKLNMEAFSYDDNEMTLSWHQIDSVVVAKSIEIPSYSLTNVQWFSNKAIFTTGTYSLLTVQFELERRLGFHLIQIYLPSYLIVILAWVSFWVDREQTAARIAMGITTVLTMATLIGSARVSLPRVSYVKSLELFLIMCFLFVFSAILEYAFVSYLVFRQRVKNREDYAQRDLQRSQEILESDDVLLPIDPDGTDGTPRPEPGQEAVWIPGKHQVETVLTKTGVAPTKKPLIQKKLKVDNHFINLLNKVEFSFRIAFPLTFLILNVIYWIYYVTIANRI